MSWLELYESISVWCFNHQVEADLLLVLAGVGSVVLVLRRQRRARRRLHRYLWGMMMTREQREWLIKMRFEDALVDAAMEMVHDGTINEHLEREYLNMFAEKLSFAGLKPKKNVKGGIQARLKKRFGLKPVNIPGGKPGVDKIDQSYNPDAPEMISRYAQR